MCKYLIEIVYPEGTDSKLLLIDRWAFGGCYNLQRMNPFPGGLVELGVSAFDFCKKLQGRITIPASIRYVRDGCFNECISITSVIFEPSTSTTTTVVELEDGSFENCRKLLSVRLPNNVTVIPMECFYACCSLVDMDLPESVIVVGEAAYYSCSALARVTIRSSTNTVQIGRDVFVKCPSLATIRVANPLVWSRVLSAMNTDPSFLYKFVRKYEGQIMTHHRSSR